ncbi:MAG: hypothetical protein GY787_21060 [Alteromonadales bacterium]|nr:hypothetical protein [Alteromonadales bacterium]
MTIKISILIFTLLLLGALVDYVKHQREKKRVKDQKEIIRLQSILFRAKRLLNGSSLLPLTVVSTLVCLERILAVLNKLKVLKSSGSLREVEAEIQFRLTNFKALSTDGHLYSLLPIPDTENKQQSMLKQSLLLAMTLKVDLNKGYACANIIQEELDQLAILKERLISSIYHKNAMQKLENKDYERALSLNNKAIELLSKIKCTDENVIDLNNIAMNEIQLINEGLNGVIQEKSHDFYEKHKEEVRQAQEDIHEKDDGLGRMFPTY